MNPVNVRGKNILGRKRSKLEGGNEFGMSMGKSEDHGGWKCGWKILSLSSLG